MTRARTLANLFNNITSDLYVSGIVTASSFFGDGAGITGITAVGTGVTILDGNVDKGAASRINFGDHFTVSNISSGIATITVGVTTEYISSNQINNAGVVTTGSAIVGTAVTINSSGVNATGVITATTFSGSITGTSGTASFATTAFALSGTPNLNVGVITATSLVAGVSTFSGITTVTGVTLFAKSINVSGLSTIFELDIISGLEIPGFSTISNGGYSTIGIVTASSYRGDGSQLTGISAGSTSNVSTSTLVVAGVSTFLDKISIRTSLASNEYASLNNAGKLILGDGSSTTAGIDIVNNTSSSSAEIFTISTPNVNLYSKKIVVDYGGRLLLGGNLTSSINNALTIIDNSGNISLNGYVSAGGTMGASALTAGTVQISSGIVTATSGIVTYYGDTSNAADGRWTLGASGSAHYTFTGIGFTQTTNDPVLYLTRGRVYEFVNNSGGSHPFQIRTNYSGTAYNAGVTNNGAASGTIRFEVPFSAPNTLYYQCTNHAGMGATIFVTKSSDLISVKDFGALGDGSSDDTTFIQNAVNSISATGGTIYFPQGVYKITAPITISNNTSTYGEGQASVIRPGVGVTAIFQYSNTSNVNVEKLQFDGVNTTTLTALYFPGGINNSFVYVSDCFFATMNTAIEMATDSYIVANNYAIDANTFLYGSNAALNGSVNSNYVLGGQYSVRLRSIGGNQAEGVRIYDNTFLNTSSTALSVFIQSALEVEIFNNIIDQVGTSGYSIYASPESGDTIASIKATNNWCDSGNGGGSIYFYDCNQVIVDSNTFNSSSGIGTALTIQNTNTFFATKNICLNAFTNAASYTSSTNQYQSGNIYSASVGAATTFERNVFANDLAVGVSSARGVILTSPNGTKYRLHVSDAGAVNTVLVT